jgi:hypothetical protein
VLLVSPGQGAEPPAGGESAPAPDASPAERAARLVGEYLGLRLPDAGSAERVAKLIAGLGSSEYAQREAASKELVRLGQRALPALEKAASSADAEVAERARAAAAAIRESSREAAIVEELWVLWPEAAEVIRKELALAKAAGEPARGRGEALTGLGAKLKLDDPSGKAAAQPLIETLIRSIIKADARRITDCCAGEALAMSLFAAARFKGNPERVERHRFRSLTVEKLKEEDGVVTLVAALATEDSERLDRTAVGMAKVGGRWRVTYVGEGEEPPARQDCTDATLVDYQAYVRDPKKTLRELAKLLPEKYRESLTRQALGDEK